MKSKSNVPPKARWPLAALAAVFLVLSVALACLLWPGEGSAVAFTVNGTPVTTEHEQLYLDNVRARTAAYFKAEYGADINEEGFWETEFDGETPAHYQRRLARMALVRDMVERQLARGRGIDVSLTLAELEAEREARNSSGELKYGPGEYGTMEYLSQTQSLVQDALKEQLLAGVLAPTEEDLRGLYGRGDVFSLLDAGYFATVRVFACSTLKAGEYPEELHAALTLAGALWTEGADEEAVLRQVEEDTGIHLESWESAFDTGAIPKEDDLLFRLAETCRNVELGKVSGIWESGVTRGVAVMEAKEDRGMASFEESRTILTNLWINEQYEAYLTEAVAQANISGT